jgi:hypothetical protein
MLAALTQLAIAAGTAAVEAVIKLVQKGREREPAEAEAEPEAEQPPHAGWTDIERQRQHERSSIAHKVKR